MCIHNLYRTLVLRVERIMLSGGMRSIMTLRLSRRTRETSSNILDVPVHPGLIVLRESGLSRQEQWEWLKPVVEFVKKSADDDFLLNKLIEITGVGKFKIRVIPEP